MKEEKRLIFSELLKTNKTLGQSLYRSCRHRVPSQEFLRGLESPGRKMSLASAPPWNQPEREMRERKEVPWGPKSLVEQRYFNEFCGDIYTILQGS